MVLRMDSIGLPDRVWKMWKCNYAISSERDLIAGILDWKDPIYPTSVVGHTLWNILMFLIDEGLIEWRVLDHASWNGVLWIIMVCYDLVKEKKITEVFFNDICDIALGHSKEELTRNIPTLNIPSHFTNKQGLEDSLWWAPLDFAVSNIFQDPDPDTWSNLQYKETERIYELLGINWRIVVKGPDYAPKIRPHFEKFFEIERRWEWDCSNRYAWWTPARVEYLLWIKKGAWV